jgi:hypothetical protein
LSGDGDDGEDDGRGARLCLCARCARTPRDPDDRRSWVTINDDTICPGCLTLNDRERLRMDDEP